MSTNYRLGAVEGWAVTQDGETIKSGLATVYDAYKWLHRRQSQSVDWAIRHEGWDIVFIQDGMVVQSYKQDAQRPELGAARPRKVKATKLPLAKADQMAGALQDIFWPYVQFGQVVGSVRRRSPTVGDVELVVLPYHLGEFVDLLDQAGFSGGDRKRVGYIGKVPIEIYLAHDPKEIGGLVFMYTGDWQFNIAMRLKAKKRGLKLNQYGIWKGDEAVLQSEDEVDFFEFLGVRYHAPEERSIARKGKATKRARMGGSEWVGEEE